MIDLQRKYSRDEFLVFLKSFIPDFQTDIRKVALNSSKVTKDAIYLGESSVLGVSVFELTHNSSFDARISLATDGFRIMKDSASYKSLIVYRSEENENWRLSLMTASLEATEQGRVAEKYSNPRRYSFYLGPDAKVNTPYQYLVKEGAIKNFKDLQDRFSIEVVNKEFYKEISQAFTMLVNGLLKLPSIQDKSQTSLEFAVRLIGRIIFCWFLREKKSENGLALMPKELLSLEAVKDNNDYYHKILEPIFFEILNKPLRSRRDDFAQEPFSSVPYLNGGLFSPQDDDFYKRINGDFQSQYHNTLTIPDSWFKNFFEILETYNFTIDENTSFDEELSIDPEMLGRIFENLLAEINPETGESTRKSTGSYYTPRNIVNYMVDESLLLYLKEQTKIEGEKLRAIISYDLTDDSAYPLVSEEKEKIISALENLKLLDPACGSGAFPIGALQKIVFVLQQIDPEGQLWFKRQIENTPPELRRVIEREFAHKNFDYIRKLGIIRENIYGIDIQPIATEIARLRCLLTLIVDESVLDELENRGIEPLPNLDFKFVIANSLIGLPKIQQPQQSMFDDYQGIDVLKQIKDQYFNASGIEREQLKTEFVTQQKRLVDQLIKEHGFMGVAKAELTQKLTDWEPFTHKPTSWFDPEWMFGITYGFDIVIGNPPYGLLNKKQNQKLGHQVSEVDLKYFKDVPLYNPAQGGMLNAYRLFVCQSINLLKDSGSTSLIFPLAFMCDLSAANLRKYILNTVRIDYIEAFPERDNEKKRVFEAVKMSVCILGASKSHTADSNFTMRMHEDKYIDLTNGKSIVSPSIIRNIDPINYTIPLVNPEELKLLSKIGEKSERLAEIGKCYTGEIDLTFNKDLLTENNEDAKLIKGAQVQKYKLSDVMSQGEIMHLNENMYKKSTSGVKATHNKYRRIIMQGITGVNEDIRLKMTIINPPTYCANSVNYLIPKEDIISLESLLGILNSKLMNWYFKKMSTNSNVNGYEVDNLPILKNIQPSDNNELARLVKEILDTKNDQLIEKVDQIVYMLYGLTPEEIEIIERSNLKRKVEEPLLLQALSRSDNITEKYIE